MRTIPRISTVTRCLQLGANTRGRDWVVGDLHGNRLLLERELDDLNFDPARDRVLSVGDLIDRGPHSLATLSLLEEPWFHAVLGNHELMLLNFLGFYGSRIHSRKSFPVGRGEWVVEALGKHRKAVLKLAERVARLPLAIHVENSVPFNVMHGDLHPIGSRQECLVSQEAVCIHDADVLTCSRSNINEAQGCDLLDLRFAQHSVRVSETPIGILPITYVGHTPVRHITVHNSYVHIDQGVGAAGAKQADGKVPTVLDAREFAYWLSGVASARSQAVAA